MSQQICWEVGVLLGRGPWQFNNNTELQLQSGHNLTMTEISKYINLLIQFGEKLEGHLNKKYRPFIKSMLSLHQLNKNVKPQKIALSTEMIAFKLGVQSKSTKCIQMTLQYLYRLFSQGFIDLNAPNYCQNYMITQSNIEKKQVQKYDKQMRNQITKWLQMLVHFKNNQINNLVLKIYQYLIGQPILNSLLQISEHLYNQQCYSLICSYFNYRYYLYEQSYYYSKQEIAQFKYVPNNEKIHIQIQHALDRQQLMENLIQKYLNQIVSRVAGEGGKYGVCVICNQPAQYFCKITKASLCGMECKKKHLQIAEKQNRNHHQALFLFNTINQSLGLFGQYLTEKQSPFLFSIMASLMEKPYLFQLVKPNIKIHLRNYLPGILCRAYESKNQQIIETLYFMIASLAKWWPSECLSEIEHFIKQYILKVLKDKKPNFRQLILVFKSLDRIFEFGRSVVQLFINLDCQVNQTDVIGQILFQLSKIAQDKFSNSNFYSKQQKITIKNSCMTLFMTFSKSLNQFRKNYTNSIGIKQIDKQKQRKPSLQRFVQKFNEHWSEGLKTLFNLNLVGLDSNQQIVNIIMSLAGLNKKMIDSMMFDQTCKQYLQIFMSRLDEPQPLIFKLLSFYKFIPMTQNDSIGLLKFVETFKSVYNDDQFLKTVKAITKCFMRAENFEDFKNKMKQFHSQQSNYGYLYLRMLSARKPDTIGKKKNLYTLCLSHSYLQPMSSPISLLQIPLSYMLQTAYDPDKVVNLTKQLIPICVHSNWLSLLVKHSGIDSTFEQPINAYNVRIIKGILEAAMMQADFIMDWLTVFNFISNLYYLLTQNHPNNKKQATQNKTFLSGQVTSLMVENCLVNASIKCIGNFNRFISGVLEVAKQQLVQDKIMMLQKFFHMLDANVEKYIANFGPIFQDFRNFVIDLKQNVPAQTYIYIADMLKQLLLKLLKSIDIKDQITVSHLQIFQIILQKNNNNRQVGDFVMNCLSTIVLYNFNLKPLAWKQTIQIVDEQAKDYADQAGTIIRKILNQQMKNIENQNENLLKICYKLINPNDNKSSVEVIHDIKIILDLSTQFISDEYDLMRQKANGNDEAQLDISEDINNLHRLLVMSIEELIKFIGEDLSETVAQTLFLLFNTKILHEDSAILTQQQINRFIALLFAALQNMDKSRQDTADRIMNETLFWCAKNKNKGIVQNLEYVIIGQYNQLTITALKCIKTYIQMVNLRDQKQWQDVQKTLLRIIQNTEVERYFDIENKQTIDEQIQDLIENKSESKINFEVSIEVSNFVHECKLQMMSVELLPNHKKCLQTLQKVYDKKIKFNDHVLMRTALWRKGLGKEYPPDLLNLEQTISNRIMAIHIWQNDSQQILQFCYKILQRYIQATQNLQKLSKSADEVSSHSNNQHYEYFNMMIDYWNKRRQPLIKLIGYIMPKLTKYCKEKADKKRLLLNFIRIMPIVQNKQSVIKTIRELSQLQIG